MMGIYICKYMYIRTCSICVCMYISFTIETFKLPRVSTMIDGELQQFKHPDKGTKIYIAMDHELQ